MGSPRTMPSRVTRKIVYQLPFRARYRSPVSGMISRAGPRGCARTTSVAASSAATSAARHRAEHKWRPTLTSAVLERYPMFSPDGQWLAYATDESGRNQVYVQRLGSGPRPDLGTGGLG